MAMERVLKWLVLVLFAYVVTPFLLRPHWLSILHATLILSLPHSGNGWATIVAILGTTISPYLFFWQASEEVEEEKALGRRAQRDRVGATNEELSTRRLDVGIGTLFSNVVMFFIILTQRSHSTCTASPIPALLWKSQRPFARLVAAGRFCSSLSVWWGRAR